MQIYRSLIIAVFALLALASIAVASMNQEISKVDYLAPLLKAQDEEHQRPGEYLVTLRDDYNLAEHLEHIGESLHANPSTERDWRYFEDINTYYVTHLTDESLDRIRRDPGVEEVVENEWWEMIGDCTENSPC